MAKYIVQTPWFGVKKGDIIEVDKIHPALENNVELLKEGTERTLQVATPSSQAEKGKAEAEAKAEAKIQAKLDAKAKAEAEPKGKGKSGSK